MLHVQNNGSTFRIELCSLKDKYAKTRTKKTSTDFENKLNSFFVTWRPILEENTAPITFLLHYFFASISSIASLLASSGTFTLNEHF